VLTNGVGFVFAEHPAVQTGQIWAPIEQRVEVSQLLLLTS
jgi:hypothetical protein